MSALVISLQLALVLGIPALIAARVPKRWRIAAILAWLCLPVAIILAMVMVELAAGSPPAERARLFYGLAIIAAVGAVPWILTSVAGFAIGLALRARSAASPGETTPSRPPAPPSALPAVQPPRAAAEPPSSPIAGTNGSDPYHTRRIAPDGSLQVDLEAVEWSNSHWVNSPRVTEIATGRILLDLWGSDWDAVAGFPRPRALGLSLRRYHEGGALEAEIDLDREVYAILGSDGERQEGPLSGIADALDQASRRAAAAAAPSGTPPASRPGRIAYRPVLVILIGALIAVAALTFLAQRLAPPPAQTLTPLPKPPRL